VAALNRCRLALATGLALWGAGAMLFAAEPAAGTSAAPAPPAAAEASAAPAPDDLRTRLAALEKEVAAMQAEIDRLRAAGAATASTAELERRIEALSQEVERLRLGAAASAPKADQSVGGLGPAASKVYRAGRGVSIGGYGEMVYLDPSSRADDGSASGASATADLQRAVLYFGYKFDDRWLFNSEIEFEHAVAGDGEKGEVEVEFAYVDWHKTQALGARGGLLLVPMGFLNELHEPPIFFGVERPEVETVIIPTTWRELGGGVYGQAGPVTWKAYLLNSLNAAGFSAAEGIREGRQEGAEAAARNLALTGRVDWMPVQGAVLGAGLFAGDTAQDATGVDGARLVAWEMHAEYRWRGLRARALFAQNRLSNADEVSVLTGQVIGSRQTGYYVEAGYNVLDGRRTTSQELSPFVRYEALDTQAAVAPGTTADPANDRRDLTVGLHYRPIPNIAIKFDWQDQGNSAGTGVDQYSVGLGWLF
jgi:uncharacterized small protein (DUF1192 family)